MLACGIGVVSISLMLSGCKSNGFESYEYVPPVFPFEHKAQITPITGDLLFGPVTGMFLCDSVAVMCSGCVDNDYAFQVVSLADGRHVGAFAHRGRAGNELSNYACVTADVPNGTIYAVDDTRLLQIDMREAIGGGTQYVTASHGLGGRNTSLRIHAAAGRILHTEARPRYILTDIACRDTLARCNIYPALTPVLDADSTKAELYYSYCTTDAVSPDGRRMVSITNFGMSIAIFDIGADRIVPRIVRRFYEPKMAAVNYGTDDCIFGGFVQSVTDRYIYAIYDGRSYGEIKKGGAADIAVFDWDGREVGRYTFDERIVRFAVTPDDTRAYCWVQDAGGEEDLGYFDLVLE